MSSQKMHIQLAVLPAEQFTSCFVLVFTASLGHVTYVKGLPYTAVVLSFCLPPGRTLILQIAERPLPQANYSCLLGWRQIKPYFVQS